MDQERMQPSVASDPARPASPRTLHRAALALTLLFVLAAVAVSTALVVHTAWRHELENGFFSLLFAVLSAKAALLWLSWSRQPDEEGPPAPGGQKT